MLWKRKWGVKSQKKSPPHLVTSSEDRHSKRWKPDWRIAHRGKPLASHQQEPAKVARLLRADCRKNPAQRQNKGEEIKGEQVTCEKESSRMRHLGTGAIRESKRDATQPDLSPSERKTSLEENKG